MLAVAYRAVRQQEAYRTADERELVFAGFLAFIEPPPEDAVHVLTAMQRDGGTVKILTGDSDLVARHGCTKVGLEPGRIVLGEELARMTDPALGLVAEGTTIFARVSPDQKNWILLAPSVEATSWAFSAMASTTPPPCTPPMSASRACPFVPGQLPTECGWDVSDDRSEHREHLPRPRCGR